MQVLNDERQHPVTGPHHVLETFKRRKRLGLFILRGEQKENIKLPKKSRFDLQNLREPPSNPCPRARNIQRKKKGGRKHYT